MLQEMCLLLHANPTGWGPQSIAFSCLKKVAEIDWVYGRYNELVHGGYFMVYKPTNITGGLHPVSPYLPGTAGTAMAQLVGFPFSPVLPIHFPWKTYESLE